ncbi:hypothetical protein MYAM1_003862 [Malassezia yamatoensis]|uniref:Uncharacterized protein n=1 Tax=Malassezia yamatoensis TaxID=253288 RepID=A0AAJ5YVM9_9BASI|nr:hypothetical protein MYAM1_003862 [Malassezia yamatoensis]
MTRAEIAVDTILFDMDGTLLDSTEAVNNTWKEFADKYHLDMEEVLRSAHGHRTIENLPRFIPSLKGTELLEEAKRFESRILELAEEKVNNMAAQSQMKAISEGGIVALPGAKELLAQINAGRELNPSRRVGWAVVTSATSAYARQAFQLADLCTPPDVFVTGDMVSHGKPNPEPYEKGASLSGVQDIKRCLVVEDAPPGVASGKAANALVLGLETTHDASRMWERGADYVAKDLSKVQARWEGDQLLVTIDSEPKP